jgi:hypothetical protein
MGELNSCCSQMMNRLRVWLFVLCFAALPACSVEKLDLSSLSAGERSQFQSEVESYKHLGELLELCRSAQKVEVFEGLPHPSWERELLAQEQARRDVFRNHDFSFYQPPLLLPAPDRDRLISEVTRRRTFMAWRGPKKCGGFHPDLLLRFHHSSGVVDVHLCFGCGEAIFYGPHSRAHVDFSEATSDRWEEIQKRNQTKRPARR